MLRELCTAYRLLEDQSGLRPGDAVIVNAANSTVGQALIQLSKLLRLRCVAVVRATEGPGDFERDRAWLSDLGADEVLRDAGNLSAELDRRRFFSRPKVAFDSVGGASSMRITDALGEGGRVVVFGCASGRAPQWPWQQWVFKHVRAEGFNVRRWMQEHPSQVQAMLDPIAKLVSSGGLRVNFTEYELSSEFAEALEHASEPRRNTKVLLRNKEVAVTY